MTFHPETQYLYVEFSPRIDTITQPVATSMVYFEAYDVCPAFIIVKNGNSNRWRCPRDWLFNAEKPL